MLHLFVRQIQSASACPQMGRSANAAHLDASSRLSEEQGLDVVVLRETSPFTMTITRK